MYHNKAFYYVVSTFAYNKALYYPVSTDVPQ